MKPPSAEGQVEFLVRMQRLLEEGSFVATYKFALLLALAQVSIERGDDSGEPLRVGTRELAEHFVRLYWRQAVPYVPLVRPEGASVLKQNTGAQAAVLRRLVETHARYGGSLPALMRDRRPWQALLAAVARTIEVMPLWRLQLVGRQELRFLYERGDSAHEILLKPGVAFCLRRFHPLIQDLVQGAWVRFVRSVPANRGLIGEASELSDFLFGSDRASLAAFHPILRDLQAGGASTANTRPGVRPRSITSSRGRATRWTSATTSSWRTRSATRGRGTGSHPKSTSRAGASATSLTAPSSQNASTRRACCTISERRST